MPPQVNQKSFSQKINDTGFLLRNTFNILWLGGPELKRPTINAVIYSLFTTLVFFLAIFLPAFWGATMVIISILLLLFWVVLHIYGFFYYTRLGADQSLMVYKSLTGDSISFTQAHQENRTESWKIRGVAFVNLLISGASAGSSNDNEGRGGIKRFLFSIFFFILTEVWDLVSNYLLPSVVIEKKPIKEIIPNLKLLKGNIPSVLVGVFGIDFAGAVFGSLMGFIYFAGIILSVIVGYLAGLVLETGTVEFGGGILFNFYPMLFVVFVIAMFGSAYSKIINSIKAVYYSCFYTSLAHPEQIKSEYKQNIENYLNFRS